MARLPVISGVHSSPLVFSANPERRLVVKELLAVPRNKVFYKTVGYGELQIEETK